MITIFDFKSADNSVIRNFVYHTPQCMWMNWLNAIKINVIFWFEKLVNHLEPPQFLAVCNELFAIAQKYVIQSDLNLMITIVLLRVISQKKNRLNAQ